MCFKYIFILLISQFFAKSSILLDTGKYREAPFSRKIDLPVALNFNGTAEEKSGPKEEISVEDSVRQKKNLENLTTEKNLEKDGNHTESVVIRYERDGTVISDPILVKFPEESRNETEEKQSEEFIRERPDKGGFGYRKRTKKDEDNDYLYEYETGDYFWKRKSVRVVLPKEKNQSNSREGATTVSTTLPDKLERKPETRNDSDLSSTEISDFGKSYYLNHVEFDDKYFSCPDNFNGTYPITGYCNRYVNCISGKPFPAACRGGLHFDLVSKRCDLPRNSFCNYACPRESGYFGIPGECNGFFSCRNWYPRYRSCPPHKHWDAEKELCTDEESSPCPLKCTDSYEVKQYEGDCRSYVICEKKLARYRRCPSGTKFDLKSLGCVHANSSECLSHPKFMIFRDYSEKNICAKIGIKGELFTWCKETPPTSAPDPQTTSEYDR